MRKTVLTVLPLALALAACGNDSAPPAATEAAAPASEPVSVPVAAPESAPSTPQVAPESTAAPVTDEVVYDPIDTSKLQSSWWQQFNKGG